MTDAEREREARAEFRVISDPSWQVQRMHEGQWVTGYYSANQEAANRRLEKCVASYVAWSKMTEEERMQRILREVGNSTDAQVSVLTDAAKRAEKAGYPI